MNMITIRITLKLCIVNFVESKHFILLLSNQHTHSISLQPIKIEYAAAIHSEQILTYFVGTSGGYAMSP
jgi:hypothetical protein